MPLVTRGHDGHRLVVAAACPAAARGGLRPGMPLAHAQALVPGLHVHDAAPADDADALRRLAAWCLRLSPHTAPDAPDGVWIDATGCAHLHGGERPMLRRLLSHLARAGTTARAAVADTPGAAHALARFGPDPATVVEPGATAAALAPLPVAALRLGAETVAGLRRLGLGHVADLVATPRGPLARRFGPHPLHRLDQALGRAPEAIQPVLPPGTVAARRAFAEPISTAEAIRTVIPVLVAEACAALERRGEGARRLDLVFERVDATVQVLRIGTARPARGVPHLARLLDERVPAVDPGPGIEAMHLVLPATEPLPPAQDAGTLGDSLGELPAPDLSDLVDRLLNRIGPRGVYRLHPAESDVPERAERPVPPHDPAPAAWTAPWPRPVRLLPRPEPVEALAMLPSHPPRAFTWRSKRHLVARADGPERITGEWWRAPGELAAVRDYWAVEDGAGRRFWLFRQGDGSDPATGNLSWFLHGFF